MKDKLNKLILFIDETSKLEGNEWFKEALLSKLLLKNETDFENPDLIHNLIEKVDLIKKYLAIDVIPIIDYSEIEDSIVRTQLFRDSIEMAKYRHGKINNLINFDEFCRYAHYQAEELINYFYSKKFTDISGVCSHIQSTIGNTFLKKPENLNHIDYFLKLKCFVKSNKITGKTKQTLEFLNTLRNEMSHRNSLQKEDDDSILIECKNIGLELMKYQNLAELDSSTKELFYKGKFIMNKRLQDYNAIYDALASLKKQVINELKLVPST